MRDLVLLVIVICTLTFSGCVGNPPAPASGFAPLAQHIGRNVVVQIRRDALGAAAGLPVSPMTDSINGAETTIVGPLRRVEGDWLVLEDSIHREVWVPLGVVLAVRIEGPADPATR